MSEEPFVLPEPSFEDKLAQLQQKIGRHPAYKDRFGRDLDDSDSENELSDGTMERLDARDQDVMDEKVRATRLRLGWDREEAISERVVADTNGNSKQVEIGKEKKKETEGDTNGKKRQNDLPRPASPQPKRKRPLSFEEEDSPFGMDVDEPAAPVAGPSVNKDRPAKQDRSRAKGLPSKRTTRTSSAAPPATQANTEEVVLELSSDSDPPAVVTKRGRPPKSAGAPSKKAASMAAASSTKAPAVKGKKKARLSMEQAIEAAQKIKVDELKTRFADISSFIDHLTSHELDRPGKLLEGCRVLFVNTDHWKASNSSGGIRNRFDQGLRLQLGIVARHGGTLVKPEDFVAAPQDANPAEMNATDIERRAEQENWTTHIIGFHPSNSRPPSFKETLACIGEHGVTAEGLGPYVKVVSFAWVTQCITERKRQSEWEFAIKGDPREVPSTRVSSTKSSPTKKAEEKSYKDRRQGRKRGPDDGGDTTEESHDEEDEGAPRGSVSPFGAQDYPVGERPPTHPSLAGPPSTDALDASEPIATKASNALEGLEEQSKIVKQLGAEQVDSMLHEEPVIYTGVNDDCETENEDDEADAQRGGKAVPKADLREKRPDRTGYAVNREFVPPGQKEGPNDATADVLLQLAEFHKGDQWRERGYRMAAGELRRLKHKVTDYKDLVKIKGIGGQIAEKIVEINQTGTHRKLSNELPEDKAARLFSGIYGIGLVLGHNLAKRGAKTIEDLHRDEYYSTLTPDQQIGLKYYDDLLQRIPRAEVTELYQIVLEAAREVDPKLQVECMGSYRRLQANSGDIDILVTRDPTQDGKTHSGAIGKMYKILRERKFFHHILSQSDDWSDLSCKVYGLCRLSGGLMRRIDILGVPWNDMPAALIYFTGNDHFNRSLRLKARHMGYSLNQKCLSKSILRGKGGEKLTEGTRIDVKDERDIFRILNVPYKRPEERIPS